MIEPASVSASMTTMPVPATARRPVSRGPRNESGALPAGGNEDGADGIELKEKSLFYRYLGAGSCSSRAFGQPPLTWANCDLFAIIESCESFANAGAETAIGPSPHSPHQMRVRTRMTSKGGVSK